MNNIVIFDIDGTLALNEHRQHFLEGDNKDWKGFFENCHLDEPCRPVIELAHFARKSNKEIILLSGRPKETHDKTINWMVEYNVPFDRIVLRPEDNYEPDYILKENWISRMDKEEIYFAVEDRTPTVKMYRRNGIFCFQVADGDF